MEAILGRIRRILEFFKDDYNGKTLAFSIPSTVFSLIYASFTGIAAIWSRSLWLGVMTVFYLITIFMRISVISRAGISLVSKKYSSVRNYRSFCFKLLVFDILFGISIVFFHLHNIHKDYPGFTIYITAIYVLIRVVLAVINMVRAHKSNSYTTVALRKINAVKALVSLLILQGAILSRFANPHTDFTRNFNSATGFGAFLIILLLSLGGFWSTRKARS